MHEIGLTKNEFIVYETLLKTGACTISSLSKECRLDQRSIYDYIERLRFKGLVGQMTCNNKRLFLGLNPNNLEFLIDEEKEKINNLFDKLSQIKEENEIETTIIENKLDFLRFIKNINHAKVLIGEKFSYTNEPDMKYFLKNKSTKTTKRNIAAIFTKNRFLIFSGKDNKGFMVKNREFKNNMKVYFNVK